MYEPLGPVLFPTFIQNFAMLLHQIAKHFHLLFPPPTISTSHALTPSFTEICRYWFTHNLNHSLSYLTDFWQPEWSLKAHWHTLLVRQESSRALLWSRAPLLTSSLDASVCICVVFLPVLGAPTCSRGPAWGLARARRFYNPVCLQ